MLLCGTPILLGGASCRPRWGHGRLGGRGPARARSTASVVGGVQPQLAGGPGAHRSPGGWGGCPEGQEVPREPGAGSDAWAVPARPCPPSACFLTPSSCLPGPRGADEGPERAGVRVHRRGTCLRPCLWVWMCHCVHECACPYTRQHTPSCRVDPVSCVHECACPYTRQHTPSCRVDHVSCVHKCACPYTRQCTPGCRVDPVSCVHECACPYTCQCTPGCRVALILCVCMLMQCPHTCACVRAHRDVCSFVLSPA